MLEDVSTSVCVEPLQWDPTKQERPLVVGHQQPHFPQRRGGLEKYASSPTSPSTTRPRRRTSSRVSDRDMSQVGHRQQHHRRFSLGGRQGSSEYDRASSSWCSTHPQEHVSSSRDLNNTFNPESSRPRSTADRKTSNRQKQKKKSTYAVGARLPSKTHRRHPSGGKDKSSEAHDYGCRTSAERRTRSANRKSGSGVAHRSSNDANNKPPTKPVFRDARGAPDNHHEPKHQRRNSMDGGGGSNARHRPASLSTISKLSINHDAPSNGELQTLQEQVTCQNRLQQAKGAFYLHNDHSQILFNAGLPAGVVNGSDRREFDGAAEKGRGGISSVFMRRRKSTSNTINQQDHHLLKAADCFDHHKKSHTTLDATKEAGATSLTQSNVLEVPEHPSGRRMQSAQRRPSIPTILHESSNKSAVQYGGRGRRIKFHNSASNTNRQDDSLVHADSYFDPYNESNSKWGATRADVIPSTHLELELLVQRSPGRQTRAQRRPNMPTSSSGPSKKSSVQIGEGGRRDGFQNVRSEINPSGRRTQAQRRISMPQNFREPSNKHVVKEEGGGRRDGFQNSASDTNEQDNHLINMDDCSDHYRECHAKWDTTKEANVTPSTNMDDVELPIHPSSRRTQAAQRRSSMPTTLRGRSNKSVVHQGGAGEGRRDGLKKYSSVFRSHEALQDIAQQKHEEILLAYLLSEPRSCSGHPENALRTK